MKTTKFIQVAFAILIVSACSSKKKSTPAVAAAPVPPKQSYLLPKPLVKTYPPDADALAAIQSQYKEVTLEKLKEGYLSYTEGACVRCHVAVDIYKYDATRWKGIIDNMTFKAMMSEEQKDAVYKYVIAVRSVQQK